MSEEEKGFEVRDRRKVRADGEGPENLDQGGAPDALPPIDFVSFIGSLGATALMHLGEMLAQGQPGETKDLPAAKQMIDLLDLVKEKTRGNLEKDEAEMLDNLLYNLKVRYVRETSRK